LLPRCVMVCPRVMNNKQTYSILVIDDDPTGTQLLLTLLALEGYQGCKLQNWAEPISDLQSLSPDLVLMDVRLSSMDGLELLRRIRAHPEPRIAGIPVLMMSAEDLRVQCQSTGADGFVEKPFELDTLLGAIHHILEGSLSNN
jgi:CheY-like chemotaxis protein